MRLLLVEDNESLAVWIAKTLRQSGLVVDCLHDGACAEQLLLTEVYDIVLLDLSLPRMDGLTVLRRLRARDCAVPVLILTVNSRIEDRVAGLDAGADDYLAKPFDPTELEARIRALVRRSRGAVRNDIALGALRYQAHGGQFHIADQVVDLTPRERDLLEVLITHANTPVRKQALSSRIVGLDAAVSMEAIEIHVCRLRKKLESSGVQIRTLRGLGYLLEADSVEPAIDA